MSDTHETKQGPVLQVKFAGDPGSATFGGYASVFGVVDSHNDVVLKGAFTHSLAAHRELNSSPAMCWWHDQATPIGHWTELAEDEFGLKVRGELNLKTAAGRDAFEHIMGGSVAGLSIGFRIHKDGSFRKGGLRYLKRVDLFEISPVPVGSNSAARIQLDSKSALEGLLTKSGLAKNAARRIVDGGWPALVGREPTPLNPSKAKSLAAQIARATAQLKVKR